MIIGLLLLLLLLSLVSRNTKTLHRVTQNLEVGLKKNNIANLQILSGQQGIIVCVRSDKDK